MKLKYLLWVNLLIFSGSISYAKKEESSRYKNLELFQKVLHFVESNYVDEVSNEKLIHGALKGMLETLDPHSSFLPPEIYKDMKVDTKGKFGGLGIEIGLRKDVLTVIAPIEGTPAWKAGLKPGDRIVKIKSNATHNRFISTRGMSLEESVAKMRGPKGTSVYLKVYRKGWDEYKDFKLERATIKIQSVRYEMIEPHYGYVRLSTFNESAGKDVRRAIRQLEKKSPLKGLIFDMRNTPGGLLDQAVEITSLFVPEGIVVSTVGRNKKSKEVKHVRKGRARTDFKLAVLVNSSTASAAEIVAGALQDHHRAMILGERTFGKGSVQTVMPLGDDMGLKLTIARYYTPKGRSIQMKGVIPDIVLEKFNSELLEKAKVRETAFREQDLEGHLEGQQVSTDFDISEFDSTVKNKKSDKMQYDSPKKDFQVLQAIGYLKSTGFFEKKIKDKEKKQAYRAFKKRKYH